MVTTTISWMEPVCLDYASALQETQLLKALRRQLREGLIKQGYEALAMARCVYVVRMTGPVIVAYPHGDSPVLYVGRGNAPSRLASHLKNWLHDVHRYGDTVGVELRICLPRRPNRTEFFKNVEADLIAWFQDRYGAIPFFNSRLETSYSGVIDYGPSQKKDLLQSLGTGSGKRPKWAIRPLPSNANYGTYNTGWTG